MDKTEKEKILSKIIKRIKEEKNSINNANQIDNKHYKMKINIEKLIQITENLKNKNMGKFKDKSVLITHNGNPYITYILAIKAIYSNTNLTICVNETMLGTNSVIIKIIEETLKELKINIKIAIKRNLDIETLKNKNIKIFVLQDKSQYAKLLKLNIQNVFYKPIYNLALYIDDEEFEDIKQDIIKYCHENFIEIEIYEADNIENAIEQLESDNEGEDVLILTKQKTNIDKIKNDMKIYINKNILNELQEKIIEEEI